MPHRGRVRKQGVECLLHPDKEWRWIPGFEGRYMVSSCGDIRMHALPRQRITALRPPKLLHCTKREGYSTVYFGGMFGKQQYLVHRLVLLAFVGAPPPEMEGGHLDGTRANNHRVNLRWVTRKENAQHRCVHGTCRHGEHATFAKLTTAEVQEMRRLYHAGHTQKALATIFHVREKTVQLICAEHTWRHALVDNTHKAL